MKKLPILALLILILGCAKEQPDLIVKANIKGLKKGTVFLKKIKDTTLVTLDSVIVNGNAEFELVTPLDSPEMYYLFLNKNSNQDEAIAFFADKGITEINTTLKNFVFDAKIKGSAQHSKWEEYKAMISRLNERNLDLIVEKFEAQKSGDTAKLNAIETENNGLLKRKYLYTVNFALNNKDSEVAPYLALTEIYNARINFLDTINKALTPKVKNSKYGKELQIFIDGIKKSNTNKK